MTTADRDKLLNTKFIQKAQGLWYGYISDRGTPAYGDSPHRKGIEYLIIKDGVPGRTFISKGKTDKHKSAEFLSDIFSI